MKETLLLARAGWYVREAAHVGVVAEVIILAVNSRAELAVMLVEVPQNNHLPALL